MYRNENHSSCGRGCGGCCSRRFISIGNPQLSDKPDSGRGKRRAGIISRWLEKLAAANEREFGPNGPCCH